MLQGVLQFHGRAKVGFYIENEAVRRSSSHYFFGMGGLPNIHFRWFTFNYQPFGCPFGGFCMAKMI
jgi:hypothetical protein